MTAYYLLTDFVAAGPWVTDGYPQYAALWCMHCKVYKNAVEQGKKHDANCLWRRAKTFLEQK